MSSRTSHSSTAAKLLAVVAAVALLAGCTAAVSSPGWTYGPAESGSGGVAASAAATPTLAPTPIATVAPTAALAFTPGTKAAPRVVELSANDLLNFTPGLVQAAMGETVTFRIHNTGKATHEFMVGLLADAFADKEGTPEVADIGPDQTGEITTTFDGPGPFAFACHAPGHFEHGMAGYIQLVGPGAPTVGTKDNPRVVWMNMDDTLKFMPDSVAIAKGETIRFVLTNSGTVVHEFAVGDAAKVDADVIDGVAVKEADELDAGSTHALDFTFDGSGPFGYACHEPGHFEAGMKGSIVFSN